MARTSHSLKTVLLALSLALALPNIQGDASQDAAKECIADLVRGPAEMVTRLPSKAMLQRHVSRERSQAEVNLGELVVDRGRRDMRGPAMNETVTPPPQPQGAPLQQIDGALADEIQEWAQDSGGDPVPVMLLQVLMIWKFVAILCASAAAVLVLLVVCKLWFEQEVFQQQVAKLQFFLVLALLIACPASRAKINSMYGTAFWILAVRNVLEMWLMLLSFCALPYMVMDHLSLCCKEGDRQKKAVRSDDKFRLSPEVRQQVASQTRLHLLTSADWQGDADMEAVRGVGKQMAAILAVRPLLQIGRSIARLGFNLGIGWQTGALISGVSLVLLSVAVALGLLKSTPVSRPMENAVKVRLILWPLQIIVATLLVGAQTQDLVLVVCYGSEKLAQVYTSVLFMMEILAALLAGAALLTADPMLQIFKWHAPELQTSLAQRLKLLFKPYLFAGGDLLDPPASLYVRSSPAPHYVWSQKHSGMVQRNVWHGVLIDIFADKIRSKKLAAVVVAGIMTEAVFEYPYILYLVREFTPVPASHKFLQNGFEFLSGLSYVGVSWLAAALLLLGNNVYISRWWLLLTMSGLAFGIYLDLDYFFTLHGLDPTMDTMAYGWIKLLIAIPNVVGLVECLRFLFYDEDIADFYRLETASQQYAAAMLEKVSDGKEQASHAKQMRKGTTNTAPTFLMVAVIASIPVVFAFALVVLYYGLEALRFARIAQVYYQTFDHSPRYSEVVERFSVLDRDINSRISPDEAGLSTVLTLLGPLSQQLIPPLTTLWNDVRPYESGDLGVTAFVALRSRIHRRSVAQEDASTADEQAQVSQGIFRSLQLAEFRSFLVIMYRTAAIVRGLMSGDMSLASQAVAEALDMNKDGDLDNLELPIGEVALALQAVSPDMAHLVAPTLKKAWRSADEDHDSKLSVDELPEMLLWIKKKTMHCQKVLQDLVLSIVLSSFHGSAMKPDQNDSYTTLTSVTDFARSAAEINPFVSANVTQQAIDHITKVLKEFTASASEAFSLLLVAFNAILPDKIRQAEKLLAEFVGGDLSAQLAQVTEARWQDQNAEASGGDWSDEDAEKVRKGLNKLMEVAQPWLQRECARAEVFLTAIAKGVGLSLDADENTILNTTFNALDTRPKDGTLNFKELGLHGALALVNPVLASHVQGFFTFAFKSGLDKEQFGTLLSVFTQILAEYVSDVNGDGQVDGQDAKFIAEATLQKLLSSGNSSASLLQTWKPTKLRKSGKPGINLQQAISRESKTLNRNGTTSSSSEMLQVETKIEKIVQVLVTLNIDRIEAGLYVAALASFWFGVFIVAMPLLGYSEIYEKLQKGDITFKGSSSMEYLKGRLDWAALFPGLLMSTVVIGVMLIFFALFAIFTFLAIPSLYLPLLWQSRLVIFWLIVTVSIMSLLKYVVLDRICVVDGEAVYPRLFSFVYVLLIILNFAVGMVSAISRLVLMLPFMFVKFHVLSATMLDDENVSWDGGYAAYLSAVKHDHDVSNPIRHGFLQAIAPECNSLFGEKPLEEPRPQSKMQRTRNRFWTSYMISKAPQLRFMRKSALMSGSADAKTV